MMTEPIKPRFVPNVEVGTRGMDIEALRLMATNEPEAFMHKVNAEIEAKRFTWAHVSSLGHMFNALADIQIPVSYMIAGQRRAITASAFPLLSGALTVAGINAGYEAVPTIGQFLCQDIEDNKKVSTFANILAENVQVDRVEEAADFPEVGAGEEKHVILSNRNGRRMSITAEAIEENNVQDIARRADSLGRIAAVLVEKQTLRRVCDIDGSGTSPAEPYVYRPNGTGTTLYSASANTPGTRAPSGTRVNSNALVDETDLENCRAVLAAMKDDLGSRLVIPWSECVLLVPDALTPVAMRWLNSEFTPDVPNEMNNWGPRGSYRPTLVSSPRLDDLSTTAWYMGAPRRQFLRKWKLRFEYVTLSGDTQKFLESRIAFQARIAWDCEIGALDYVYFVQNIAATTAP